MVISIPLILLAGIALFVCVRLGSATGVAVCIAVLFGFLLAGTSAAPAISHLIHSIGHNSSGSSSAGR